MYETALLFSLLCWIIAVAYYVRLPCFSLFHPLTIYSAVYGLIFVVRPICGYFLEYDSLYKAFDFMPTVADKTTVIAAANISYLCFFYAALQVASQPMRFASDQFDAEERRRLTQIFIWVLVLVVPPGLYSLAASYRALGGGEVVQGMILDQATGTQVNTQSNGYLTDVQLLLAPCCAIILWLGRFKPIAFVPFLIFLGIKAGTGGRSPFIVASVMGAMFYCYDLRKRFPPVRIAWMAVGMLMVFNAIGADRGATIREMFGQKVTYDAAARFDEAKGAKFLETMDFANMEFFEYIVYVVPQRSGTYDFFLDNFQVFTEPVPRVLWTGKPVGEPFRRIWLWDFGKPIGMTRSIPGEGWYALGWLGVVLWSMLWGWGMGKLYQRFVESRQTTLHVASYIIITGFSIVIYRDGQLLTFVRSLGVYLAPVYLWFMLARYMGLPRAAELRRRAVLAARRAMGAADGAAGETGAVNGAPAVAAAQPSEATRYQAWVKALPAAAQRRRLALQSGEQGNTQDTQGQS
jgi:hypothetical protein